MRLSDGSRTSEAHKSVFIRLSFTNVYNRSRHRLICSRRLVDPDSAMYAAKPIWQLSKLFCLRGTTVSIQESWNNDLQLMRAIRTSRSSRLDGKATETSITAFHTRYIVWNRQSHSICPHEFASGGAYPPKPHASKVLVPSNVLELYKIPSVLIHSRCHQ